MRLWDKDEKDLAIKIMHTEIAILATFGVLEMIVYLIVCYLQ